MVNGAIKQLLSGKLQVALLIKNQHQIRSFCRKIIARQITSFTTNN